MRVLDTAVITQLGTDLGDRAFVGRFVGTYLRMLPGRVGRVLTALETEDHDDLMDAVLSLRTSASTVGAVALASLAQDVEQHVRAGDTVGARRAVRRLSSTAQQTCQALAGVAS
ncbi:Hpt domain-containing protein [Nocardioides sp. 31GB23]|uniref:Hpt domain-containing protein n=1 Tax=Nocardioides sp. 31GB23 TaxID=3156065 RepID=UPI0032AEBC73